PRGRGSTPGATGRHGSGDDRPVPGDLRDGGLGRSPNGAAGDLGGCVPGNRLVDPAAVSGPVPAPVVAARSLVGGRGRPLVARLFSTERGFEPRRRDPPLARSGGGAADGGAPTCGHGGADRLGGLAAPASVACRVRR